jgi:hypothetical protein
MATLTQNRGDMWAIYTASTSKLVFFFFSEEINLALRVCLVAPVKFLEAQ